MGAILPKRFEPIRLLRKDRASATFVATDLRLGRNEVVVKVIAKGAFAQDSAGLMDTFSWYRGLRHPLISEIFDAGLTPKQDLFCVRACHPESEFFASPDIASVKTLVAGVDFLHSRGRVHGAIKPSNVFAAGGGTRLADPWIDSTKELAEEDVRFTAPEVLGGSSRTIDSDLYSLGAMLYRFFSGRDPFEDSDVESLKAKYIWASPRPLASVSHVSKSIADVVTDLIHKDSSRRKPAFEALKEELDVQPVAATRAPCIGFDSLIEKTLSLLFDKPKLSVVLLEGPAGSGKTRLVEEVIGRASFYVKDRPAAICEATAPDPYTSLAQNLVSVIAEQAFDVGAPSLSRVRSLIDTDRKGLSKSEREHLERDCLSLIASISRQTRMIFVIEDVDRTSRKLMGLLTTVVQQFSEADLAILVTQRPAGVAVRTTNLLESFLGEHFLRLALHPLDSAAAETFSMFFSTDRDLRTAAQQKAVGNPLFLEEYCRSSRQSLPPRVRKNLSNVISKLPKRTRRVAEVLSLFAEPVDGGTFSTVAATSEAELQKSIADLQRLGLTHADNLSIRYPDAQSLLHSRIPKRTRTELHAHCYRCLKEVGCEDSILAPHALHGGLFTIAGMLYLRLARAKFAVNDFRSAARCYGLASDCRTQCAAAPSLDASDNIILAKCQAQQGNKAVARSILPQLLDSEEVQKQPELLSDVYATLALPIIVENSSYHAVSLIG